MRGVRVGIVAVLVAGAIGVPALPSSAASRVRMRDNFFMPRRITVEKGSRVRWVNGGSNPHTTTATNGSWDSGTIDPGDPAFSRRFRKRGTFRYNCSIHVDQGMRGKVVVV
jgi:plastocyanin